MKLSIKELNKKTAWDKAGITLPVYDVAALHKQTQENPRWVHFGIGNIFRIFLGGIAEQLIAQGLTDTGIICAETFDYDIVDRIYAPCDNLALAVTLYEDGSMEKQVLGSLAECIRSDSTEPSCWARLKAIFQHPGLQMVSFTITEKGYALRGTDGDYLPFVKKDMENGPAAPTGAMARPLKNILFFDIKFLRHVKNPPVLNELMDFCNSDRDFLYFKRYYSLIFHLSA